MVVGSVKLRMFRFFIFAGNVLKTFVIFVSGLLLGFLILKHILWSWVLLFGSISRIFILFDLLCCFCHKLRTGCVVISSGLRSTEAAISKGFKPIMLELISFFLIYLPLPVLHIHLSQSHPILIPGQWHISALIIVAFIHTFAFRLVFFPVENTIKSWIFKWVIELRFVYYRHQVSLVSLVYFVVIIGRWRCDGEIWLVR